MAKISSKQLHKQQEGNQNKDNQKCNCNNEKKLSKTKLSEPIKIVFNRSEFFQFSGSVLWLIGAIGMLWGDLQKGLQTLSKTCIESLAARQASGCPWHHNHCGATSTYILGPLPLREHSLLKSSLVGCNQPLWAPVHYRFLVSSNRAQQPGSYHFMVTNRKHLK